MILFSEFYKTTSENEWSSKIYQICDACITRYWSDNKNNGEFSEVRILQIDRHRKSIILLFNDTKND
jgi:hypothetical protein